MEIPRMTSHQSAHNLFQAFYANFEARFGVLEYNDELHEYRIGDKVLQSITNKKAELLRPFDSEGISKNTARKRGCSQELVLAEWKAIADCGTQIHELLEAVMMNGAIQRPTDHSQYSKIAHERFHAYKLRGIPAMMVLKIRARGLIPVACELKVWCGDYAGTIDLLVYDPQFGVFRVLDWKTNAKGFHEEIGAYDVPMKAPFAQWYTGHLREYSVQLESYASMLANVGFPMGDGLIIHGWFDAVDNYCEVWPTDSKMRPIAKQWLNLL